MPERNIWHYLKEFGLRNLYLAMQISHEFTFSQYPFTHSGYLTHSSQVGPDHPSLQLQYPGLVQYALLRLHI